MDVQADGKTRSRWDDFAVVGQLHLSLGATHLSVPMIIFATIVGYLGTGTFLSDCRDVSRCCGLRGMEERRRAEGIVTSSFSAKLGMGIGGVITGWILTGSGYVANHTQSAAALHGIELNYIWVPLLGFALSGIALMFYHVDGIEKQMQSELAEKHARENAEDGE